MKKLFSLFLSLIISAGTMFAGNYERVQIGDLYYELDIENKVAEVMSQEQLDNYSGLTDVNIPASVTYNEVNYSVTSIGKWTFAHCSGLTSIEIPNSVTSIGDYAFYGCTGLTYVTIPNSVTSIGDYAFEECAGLTSVTIPNSVTSIGQGAFEVYSIVEIHYNGTIHEWCEKLWMPTSISLSYVLYIGDQKMTNVVVPNSVTSIGKGAFGACTGLTSISIPNSVTSIGMEAFGACTGLTSINIPNSVTSIGQQAFDGCTALTSVTIPKSVTSIGMGAFFECSSLTSVTIPNSVTNIGAGAFAYSGLPFVTIPNSVTSIEAGAFYLCTGLTSLTIGNSVTSIEDGAFAICSSLTSITCEAVNPPTCGESVFYEVSRSIPLYVPANSVSKYKATSPWSEWGDNIKPIQASEKVVIEPSAEPTGNSVVIDWPKADGAAVYEIEIKKNGVLICTLEFNESGQLLSIAFAAPDRNGKARNAQEALQTSTGWQYTINGLDSNTEYTYTVIAKKSDDSEVYNKTVPFKTKDSATALDETSQESIVNSQKLLINGQILIIRGEKTYTLTGQEVR